MSNDIENCVKKLLSSEAFVKEAIGYMGEMLVCDREANTGELSAEGEELQDLLNMWQEGDGTTSLCSDNPKYQNVKSYYQDLFRKMVTLSDHLAAQYDSD